MDTKVGVKAIELRYSPYPAEVYSAPYIGAQYGYGMNGLLRGNTAAWNLFWLSYAPVDELLTLPGERAVVGDIPCHCPLVDACVKAVDQMFVGERLGDSLVTMHARQFVKRLDAYSDTEAFKQLEPFKLMGTGWLRAMKKRVGQFEDRADPIVESALVQKSNVIQFRRPNA